MNKSEEDHRIKCQLVSCLLLVSIGILIFSNQLHNPFQFDSVESIFHNKEYKTPEDLLNFKFFKREFFSRALLRITFAWNTYLGKMNPFGYHLVNLLFHIFNSILIFFLVWQLFLRMGFYSKNVSHRKYQSISLMTALIFLCHPIQTESVIYITSRSEILVTTFYLGAFLAFQRCFHREYTPSISYRLVLTPLIIISALIFGYSVKQSIITLPLMLTLYYFFGLPLSSPVIKWLNQWKYILGFIALASIGLFFDKLLSDEQFLIGPSNAGEVVGRKAYMLSQPAVIIFYYLKLLVFPINLNIDPDLTAETLISKLLLASVFILISFVLAWLSRFKRLFLFLIFWFFIVISPSSSIITLLDLAAEHRIYIASLGIFTLFSTLIILTNQLFLKMKFESILISKMLICILMILLCSITIARNDTWSKPLKLWMDTLNKSPKKARPWMNVGHSYINLGNDEKAIFYYEKAISINPYFFSAQYNLGTLYEGKNETQKALLHYQRAAQINPHIPEVHGKLGEIYLKMGNYEAANTRLTLAVERNPKYAEALRNLGVLHYYYLNQKKKAITFFKKSLTLDPHQPEHKLILSLIRQRGVKK